MECKKQSKGSGWECCYANKIFGTFGVEMRSNGQKWVKFCTLTHAAKLVVEMTQLPAMHGGGVNFVTLGRHRRNEPER